MVNFDDITKEHTNWITQIGLKFLTIFMRYLKLDVQDQILY